KIDVTQLHRQETAVVVPYGSRQRLLQGGNLAAHPPLGERGHGRGVCLPRDQRLQHRAPRDPEHIGRNGRQLDIGTLQNPLYAVDFTRPLLHQLGAVPRQISQIPLGYRWDKTRLQQPIAHEFGQPASIRRVRLTARDIFDMGSIHQQDCHNAFQEIVDASPILSPALHPHTPHPTPHHPLPPPHPLAPPPPTPSHPPPPPP